MDVQTCMFTSVCLCWVHLGIHKCIYICRCIHIHVCVYETRSKLPLLNCRLAGWCDAKTPKNDRGRPKYDNHS